MTAYLWFVSLSVMTAATVASLPVPEVVGTAIKGGVGRPTRRSPAISARDLSGRAARAAAAFAVSMGEPPPRAMKPSHRRSLYRA